MIAFLRALFSAWTWRMAWRDSRTSRRKLLLYSCSIVLGVAALAAIGSLGHNLERAVEEQAKSLLGADLVLTSQTPFSEEAEKLFRSIGGEQAREVSTFTMVHFPRTDDTRLALVRGLQGRFPFYGQLETQPAAAGVDFRNRPSAVIEESLMTQFQVTPGDDIRVGGRDLKVLGQVLRVPGETVLLGTFAPRVYLPMAELNASGLLRPGSLATYRIYFRFGPDTATPNVTRSAKPGMPAPAAEELKAPAPGSRDSIVNADGSVRVPQLVRILRPQLAELRLGADTVEERKKDFTRALTNLQHFLNLVGFIALLLGGVGVASAVHTHVREKLASVAVLRCLGCSIGQTFAIYLLQGMALGLAGALAGAALGLAVQALLPGVLADFLPLEFQFRVSWAALGKAMGIGFFICVAFTLLPLLAVRRVSPLAAIRSSYEPRRSRIDPWQAAVCALIAAGVVWFSLSQTPNVRLGWGFAGGLAAAFLVLTLCGWLLMFVVRKTLPLLGLPFAARQGLASLYRPGNRTLLLLLSLGLGTFLMLTLYLVQQTLLTELLPEGDSGRPNAIMYGIGNDQVDGVKALLREQKLPVLDEAPIINMRIREIKGRTVEDILAEERRARDRERAEARAKEQAGKAKNAAPEVASPSPTNLAATTPSSNSAVSGADAPAPEMERGGTPSRNAAPEAFAASLRPSAWAMRREYRSSYTATMRDSEKVVEGKWIGWMPGTEPAPGAAAPAPAVEIDLATAIIPISMEKSVAGDLKVGVGDELVFDVQGLPVKTRIASLREVNWRRVQPNFFVLFPRGALEAAPAMHVLVTRVSDSAASARMQRAMIKAFPSVSTVDMTLVVQTLDAILGKISFVIRFMAMFTVLTGILVLLASLATGRYQRMQESVLLRTLGASRRQVLRILLVEYAALGLLAAITGSLLAIAAAWALSTYLFQTSFTPPVMPVLAAMLGLPLITIATGLLMNRGVLSQPPLAVLRGE